MNRRAALLAGAGVIAAGTWRLVAGRHDVGGMFSPTAAPAAVVPRGPPLLGMNLTPINYWSPVAFSDRFKASSDWSADGAAAEVTPLGLPVGMGGHRRLTVMLPCEAGRYVLLHDGDLDARLLSGRLVSGGGRRTMFEVEGAFPTGRQFIIDAMRRAPSFMHLVRLQDEQAFAAGEIFAPELLDQLAGFDTLRFMDWMRTNGSPITDAFPSKDMFSYAAGVPLEVMTALAKKVGAHPWICVPHLAADALVKRMIAMLGAATAGGPAAYLEYSNEMWNLSFPQSKWAREQAAARWGADKSNHFFFGYRSGQIAQLARGSGCRMVIGTQTVAPHRAAEVWDGVAQAGATERDFAAWMIAPYVTGTLTYPTGPTLSLAARGDVAGAIDNLLHSTDKDAMSVDTMRDKYAAQGQIAAAHGLELVAYEANVHLNPLPTFDAHKPVVIPFFEAVVKSPLSAKVMDANLDAFAAAGGRMACLYNLSAPPSNGGVFGLTYSGAWPAIRRRVDAAATTRPRT